MMGKCLFCCSILCLLTAAGCSGSTDGEAAPTNPDASTQDATETGAPDTDASDEAASDAHADAPVCTAGETRACIAFNGCPSFAYCYHDGWGPCECSSCTFEDAMTTCTWDGDGYTLEVHGIDLVHADGTTETLVRVANPGACEDGIPAWSLAYGHEEVKLCPYTCELFEAEDGAELVLHIGCPIP
ncbi:MAG: hypothetical protein ACOC1F_07660 [Myxococcota bacterium]